MVSFCSEASWKVRILPFLVLIETYWRNLSSLLEAFSHILRDIVNVEQVSAVERVERLDGSSTVTHLLNKLCFPNIRCVDRPLCSQGEWQSERSGLRTA